MSKIAEIDGFVGCLIAKLESLNVTDKLNLILTGAAFRFREIILSEYINLNHINWTATKLGIETTAKGLLSVIYPEIGHVCKQNFLLMTICLISLKIQKGKGSYGKAQNYRTRRNHANE
jgi:hypothetical protein